MERLTLPRWGLWAFTAGIFAWIFPNVALNAMANAVTDVVIVVFAVLAAVGLPRAVDGIGTGPLRVGLWGTALCQFAQNAISAATELGPFNAPPVFVVMLGAVAIIVGAVRWREDDWDRQALPWLAGGFAAFAFEPVYYFVRGLAGGDPFNGYFPGAMLVAIGAGLAAWGFWSARDAELAAD